MSEAIDKKYLAGLKFGTSKKVKTEKGIRHEGVERALQPGDVLSWKDYGSEVVIVATDGRKHRVKK